MKTKHQPTGLEGTPLGDATAKREIPVSEPEKGAEGEDEALQNARLAAMEEDQEERAEEVEKIARRK